MTPTQPSLPRRRGLRVLRIVAVLVAAAALLGGGWFAASISQSPAQREAQASAPEAKPVTAVVQRGTLSQVVTAQATIGAADTTSVALSLPADDIAVVTQGTAAPGTAATAGSVLLAINDRPTFLVPGTFPFYRDLAQGDTGADVRQLQEALRASGYTITSREDGTFGYSTATALKALYKAAGFAAPTKEITSEDPEVAPVTITAAPRTEFLVTTLPLPATVGAVPAVGTILTADTASVTFAGSALNAVATVTAGMYTQLAEGQLGTLTAVGTSSVEVAITAMDPGDPANTTAPTSPTVTVNAVEGAQIPPEWTGAQAVLTLTLTVVDQESLLLPSSAITVNGVSQTQVTKVTTDGSLVVIPVTEIGSLNGQSAVIPDDLATLEAGDQVRVG